MNEVERIQKAYEKRDLSGKTKLYSPLNPAALFTSQQREKDIIKALANHGISDLSDKKILDLGCGSGGVLRDFVKYGASPENCYGIDLLSGRVEAARMLSPNIDFRCANAEELPYDNGVFDIAIIFTVLTSILDMKMKQNVAKELLRVLRPSGIILYYDYHMNNPSNPDVRGVKKKEILELFPSCKVKLKRITLAPPLTRAIAPFSLALCQALEKFPLLCTHYLGIIEKQ